MMIRRPPRGWRLDPRTRMLVPTCLRMGAAGASQGGGGGDYATWNSADKDSEVTLSNGDRTLSSASLSWADARGTVGKASGKWYYEATLDTAGGDNYRYAVGVGTASAALNIQAGNDSGGWAWRGNARKYHGGSYSSYGTAASPNDVVMVALDLDNGEVYFGRQGTWFDSSNPASGTNPAYTGLSGTLYPLAGPLGSGVTYTLTANFDPADMAYSIPSGFSAWSA
jgi:hypothetical protein